MMPDFQKADVLREFRAGKSLHRAYMNAFVRRLQVESPVLDLGAGSFASSSYHHLIDGLRAMELVSVDISPQRRPSLIADLERGLPLRDNQFRSCLAFNLLEHLFSFERVVRECFRVLQPHGALAISVPFLHRIHGDPHDYFRYCASTLQRVCTEAGFESVQVAPGGAGAFTAALALVEFVVPGPLRGVLLRTTWGIDRLLERLSKGRYRTGGDYPLIYFVLARKGAH